MKLHYNKNINEQLKNLKVKQYTKPIVISGGFLILKIDDIQEKEIKIDKGKEIERRISGETNEQLKRFSLIYFYKIKKDLKIYEL